jgi:hypothetical protein
MAEKEKTVRYKYTAKIKQPQSVGDVKIDPAGGEFTERQYRAVQKDAYGKSLLDKGLLVVDVTDTDTKRKK